VSGAQASGTGRGMLGGVKRVLLIVNPFASSVTPSRVEDVEDALREHAEVTTVRTEAPGHAAALAADAPGKADAVVVFSGDGTYNEAINGVGRELPIGFVPGGGTSVLPRALGLPRDFFEAARGVAEAIVAGRTRTISLGSVNGRRFTFSAGIGLDAEAVRRMDARGRSADGRRPGDVAFAATVLRLFREARLRFEPELEIEGVGRAAFVMVANGTPYTFLGPLPLRFAEAKFEEGLSFVAPTVVRPSLIPRLAARALRGRLADDAVVLAGSDLDRIDVRCDRPLPLQADGEDLGDVETAVFEAERDAVSVLV
jgi:diacylglycerol kinase family enzyme